MINRRALFYQAIRGPILLITVGALFAVQQAGQASFGRTWPILLIVIGLMKLLERSAGPVNPYTGPNSGGFRQGSGYQPPPPPSGNPNYSAGPNNLESNRPGFNRPTGGSPQ